MVVKIQVVFRVVMSCSVVIVYQHFRGTYCLHLQGGTKFLQNNGILPQGYMASQPRRPQLEPYTEL